MKRLLHPINLLIKPLFYCLGAIAVLLASAFVTHAQTYTDGPIELQVKLREVNVTYSPASDASLNLGGQIGFNPDELTFHFWARDNADLDGAGWIGGNCLQADFDPPGPSQDFNYPMLNHTYTTPTVPQFFDLRIDAWEDECGSDGAAGFTCDGNRCSFEQGSSQCCCATLFGCLYSEDDDDRCNADPFKTQMDYRLGPPCQWFDHGYVTGSCSNNFYQPRIESFWRYTRGTGCNDAIALGALTTGSAFTHFNSNECYSNNNAASPGNDVFYSFTISQPMGVNISLCGGTASFNTVLYLLNSACAADTLNDDFCQQRSQINASLCVPGTYYIVVDGATAGAMGTFTLSVTEDPSFSFAANISKVDVSCNGGCDGTAKVNVVGGLPPYTITWSGGTVATPDSIMNLCAGTYSVTVTDQKGCVATSSVTIVNPPPLSAGTIITTDVTCSGLNNGSATANPTGGTPPYFYNWSTIPPQNGNPAFALSDGVYFVTVTDVNGCTASTSFNIGTTDPLIVNYTEEDISCFGAANGSITQTSISGGTPPYSYFWVHGPTTPNISGLAPGTYDLTIVDSIGCNVNLTFTITEPAVLTSSVVDVQDVDCFGDNNGAIDISTTGGTLPYSFIWSDAATNEDRLGIAGDTFSVTITDANGCIFNLNNIIVEEPTDLVVTVLNEIDPTCPSFTDGEVEIEVLGGTGAGSYTFLWSDFSTNQNLTAAPAGSYVVMVTDDNNCNTSATATLEDADEFDIRFDLTPISCQQVNDGAIDMSVTGGTPPYTFLWSNGSTTQDLAELGPATYAVTVTDANSCVAVDSVVMKDSPLTPQECGTEHNIAVPTAFSPNGDGRNDLLVVRRLNVARLGISVFNRWGQKIYENDELADEDGWDGRYEGKEAPVGGYTWIIDVEFLNGQSDKRSGTVLLVR